MTTQIANICYLTEFLPPYPVVGMEKNQVGPYMRLQPLYTRFLTCNEEGVHQSTIQVLLLEFSWSELVRFVTVNLVKGHGIQTPHLRCRSGGLRITFPVLLAGWVYLSYRPKMQFRWHLGRKTPKRYLVFLILLCKLGVAVGSYRIQMGHSYWISHKMN